MNNQSLGGRRVTPHHRTVDADTPRHCQALLGPDGPGCPGPQAHLFSTRSGEIIGLCCTHQAKALTDLPPDWTPFDLEEDTP